MLEERKTQGKTRRKKKKGKIQGRDPECEIGYCPDFPTLECLDPPISSGISCF
jgi:hypothetical protein